MLATKSKKIKIILLGFLLMSALGLADSLYLTKKHYSQEYTCSLLDISNCESVLTSSYSTIFNIPIAVIGVIYYLLIFISALIYLKITVEQDSVRGKKNNFSKKILSFLPML
ncbi:MAG: vitamin K epoxide reductase family protein, partial [bacterium]|nr:vitamin K epoxide reductase family protein [bacterium]